MRRIILAASVMFLAGCEPPVAAPRIKPTPRPVSPNDVERTIRVRTAELDRVLEQKLANRRADADAQRAQAQIQQRLQQEIDRRKANALPEGGR